MNASVLTERIESLAQECGFDLFGIASAQPFEQERPRLESSINQGFAGGLNYLERHLENRLDPKKVLPSAKSILCLGISYYHPSPPAPSPNEKRGLVARYAWGQDYHRVLKTKLAALKSHILELAGPGTELKEFVDSGPLLEKSAAARAGLGFIGKNSLLIHPVHGSYFFLAEILTNLELEPTPPLQDGCGSCNTCLEACPTHTLREPGQLDTRRCLSYWTVEARGEIPPHIQTAMSNRVFGCDICQDICPFNRHPLPSHCPEFGPAQGPGPVLDLVKIGAMDKAAFTKIFGHTSLMRAKYSGIMRNAKAVLGNLNSFPPLSSILEKSITQSGLDNICEKILAGERLTLQDGLALYENPDILSVGALANIVREKKNSNRAYFICNLHINYTNICANRCAFCAFYRAAGQKGSYTYHPDEIYQRVSAARTHGIREIHMVGGVNPALPYSYYLEILKAVKTARPDIHIKAFTAVELANISGLSGKTLEETLLELKGAGLCSLAGGGAEIFSDQLHQELFPNKPSAGRWLEFHRAAHKAGIPSNSTMLYGHMESAGQRVEHLMQLRDLQDQTHGFLAFIPLAFHPQNTRLSHLPQTTGIQDLRNIAVPRLILDNFPHLKAFWPMITPELAQLSLSFGADDLDGTVMEEKITHAAGAATPKGIQREEIIRLIRETGRDPVERDTLYNAV